MSDFKTHLSVASLASGLAATGMMVAGVIKSDAVILFFLLGIIGGILPDIDSDTSIPLNLTFNILAPVTAFVVMFSQNIGYSLAELLIIWLTTFIVVKYLIFIVFSSLTTHRGMIHSIPAGVMFWFLTTILLNRVFSFSDFASWTAGFFLFFGFIVHLVLDELNSIDFGGRRIKSSLGTAMKLISFKNLKYTTLIYMCVICLFFLTPNPRPFFKTILNKNTFLNIRLIPKNQWFKGLSDDKKYFGIKTD